MIAPYAAQTSLRFADPHPLCRVVVVVPARNERDQLPATLEALRFQVDADGVRLDPDIYEVLLLLNNCTDDSGDVTERFAQANPEFRLHWAERSFDLHDAHVGTARSLLMNTACDRLECGRDTSLPRGLLSTDADTVVAPDWIYRNLEELRRGADAVGGVIEIPPSSLAELDPGTRSAYEKDQRYQSYVAELESRLDPDPADPWPRHLQHFGASLACTPEIYARSGGIPAIKPLEDVAFVDRLRRCNARLRHAPEVRVSTSSRLHGRAEVGLSGQLAIWQGMALTGEPHLVDSCAWLLHRFGSMGRLRDLHAGSPLSGSDAYTAVWRDRIEEAQAMHLPYASFLQQIDCDRLIEESFRGRHHSTIDAALRDLDMVLSRRSAPAHRA